jgi:hypothetical protein
MIDRHRLQWYGVLAIGAAFSAGGIAMIASGETRGWVVFFFFLVCAAMAVHELWPQFVERERIENPGLVLQRFPGPVTLRVPKMKLVFFLVSGIIFGGCLAYVALYGDLGAFGNFWLWLGVAGTVAACPAFALMILRGSTLRLDADGMQLYQGLKRSHYRWADVSEFAVADVGALSPAQTLMVAFDDANTSEGRLAAVNRRLIGYGGALPDSYGMTPWQLAALLNEWRQRALAPGGAIPPPP